MGGDRFFVDRFLESADMIDRLPQAVSQMVLSQWLSIASIVRLDTALLKSTLRVEWMELLSFSAVADTCVGRNKDALAVLSWVASRKLKITNYVVEVTKRNKMKRISLLSSLAAHVENLAIVQVVDSVHPISVRQPRSAVSFGLQSIFYYVSRWRPYPSREFISHMEYDVAKEDDQLETTLPALVLRKLTALTLSSGDSGDNRTLQWLPEAPQLQSLWICCDLLDDALLVRIALAYPHLRSVSLDITRCVTSDAIHRLINQCTALTALNLTSNVLSASVASALPQLVCSCQRLQYLALDTVALTDAALITIASRGEILLGLDLVYGNEVSSQGLSALAASCTQLTAYGITCMRKLTADVYAAINQQLRACAGTLRAVALRFCDLSSVEPETGEVVTALTDCRELVSLFISFNSEQDIERTLCIVQHAHNLQRLILSADFYCDQSWCGALEAVMHQQYPQVTLEWRMMRRRPVWGEEAGIVHFSI